MIASNPRAQACASSGADSGGHIMTKSSPAPILNTSLPASFRQIRIELAREAGHPDGFDTFYFPDFEFRVPAGWDKYTERMVETFPEDEEGIRKCTQVFQDLMTESRTPTPTSRTTSSVPRTW